MRNYTIFFLLLAPLLLLGQNNTGVLSYEEVIKIQIDLPEDVKAMAIELPTEQKSDKELLFTSSSSLYKNVETDEGPETIEGGGGDFTFKMVRATPEEETFMDLESKELTEMKEFFGKKFLIEGQQKEFQWKMTGEQRTILDMVCMKAVHADSNQTVEAWFTPQIPVSAGPEAYNGLPGMILAISIDDGKRTITATSFEAKELDKGEIKAPTKGKSVTQDEFQEIVDAKMKEMEVEMGGSGGGVRVIRRNE